MAGLTPEDSIFGSKTETNSKSSPEGDVVSSPLCPHCCSSKVWRDAKRYTRLGFEIQRWLCRHCGRRFSDPNDLQRAKKAMPQVETVETKPLKRSNTIVFTRQICVTETKNLAAEQQKSEVLLRNEAAITNGKILEYEFWLLKRGYAQSTIEGRVKIMKRLVKLGASLFDPESIKDVLAKQPWSDGRKEYVTEAYTNFLIMVGGKWDPPKYCRVEKIPFIPTEQEIDQLIAGCGGKTTIVLQILKETAMRIGEAWKLKWIDIDFVNSTIRVTPEKGSHARMFKISSKLLAMISALPRKTERLFGNYDLRGFRSSFIKQRKRTANKLGNPRMLQITFHTFRHWKATMEYHKTKDILHVMRLLGHKNIKNTLIYTQLVTFEDDEYVCKTAENVKEAKELIEAGYQYVCDMDSLKLFRKRK
ncbi:MAG: site-specific integrase [Candidatus Bathyarchaeota archaeon]|nr:site-specific integrase [Candidatus Bathyarchaeota archaeon]